MVALYTILLLYKVLLTYIHVFHTQVFPIILDEFGSTLANQDELDCMASIIKYAKGLVNTRSHAPITSWFFWYVLLSCSAMDKSAIRMSLNFGTVLHWRTKAAGGSCITSITIQFTYPCSPACVAYFCAS